MENNTKEVEKKITLSVQILSSLDLCSITKTTEQEAFLAAFNWMLRQPSLSQATADLSQATTETLENTLSFTYGEAFICVLNGSQTNTINQRSAQPEANTPPGKTGVTITVIAHSADFELDTDAWDRIMVQWKAAIALLKEVHISVQKEKLRNEKNDRYWRTWAVASARTSAIGNPANGLLLAAIAAFILLIIARAKPEALLTAGPELLFILGVGGIIFSATTILFFTLWEAYKHYKTWQKEQTDKDPNIKDLSVIDYASDFFGLPQWVTEHTFRASIVAIGILVSLALFGVVMGFFGGNETCIHMIGFLFDLMHQVLPSLTPMVGHIVGAIFVMALPLILVDVYRRASTTRHEARQASGDIADKDGNKDGYDPDAPEHDMDAMAWGEFCKDYVKPVEDYWATVGQQNHTPLVKYNKSEERSSEGRGNDKGLGS